MVIVLSVCRLVACRLPPSHSFLTPTPIPNSLMIFALGFCLLAVASFLCYFVFFFFFLSPCLPYISSFPPVLYFGVHQAITQYDYYFIAFGV